MKLIGILLASAALLGGAAPVLAGQPQATAAKPASSPHPVIDIPFQKFVLPNGLTLIVNEDDRLPLATVGVWYHVGSKDEAPGRTGFAHLFEHLLFNGSKHADDDWFKYLFPLGATNVNGTTDSDRTNFFETVPIGALDRTLWLESDRMGHLLEAVTQAKLDEQRGVVQNEKRQRSNSPFGEIPDMLTKATYPPGHPYSWETIGSMEDLNAASMADVKSWFDSWYGAGNTVIVITGDVKAAEVRDKVQKYFGFIPRGPAIKRNDKWVAKRAGELRQSIEVAAPEGAQLHVWNTPAYGTREAALLEIAAYALGGGPDSRLYRRLVNKERIASSASAYSGSKELGGQFQISASPRKGVAPADVERAIREELATFMAEGPTADELERFKLSTYHNTVRLTEQLEGKMFTLAENMLYTGDAGTHRQLLEHQYGATSADVRAAAREWLSDGVYVLNATPLPAATVVADTDRTSLPPVGEPEGLTLPATHEFVLSNGLKVALVERHSAPTVAMQMIFGGGTTADHGVLPAGTAELAAATMVKGSRGRTETQIIDASTRLGTGVGWSISQESMQYRFNGLKTTLAPALDLYRDLLVHPTFPPEIFERDRALMIANHEQHESTPRGKIGRVHRPLLFGRDHLLGTEQTVKSLTEVTLTGARQWYGRWVRPDNATLLIVGDVTAAELQPMLEARFAAWRAPAAPLPKEADLPPVKRDPGPRIYLIDQPGAQQSTISVASLAPPRSSPDFEAMSRAKDVLGGGFLGRLNLNLREDKHWSYGVSSVYGAQKRSGIFDISTSVQTDKTGVALAELNREIRGIVSDRRTSPEELERVKRIRILSLTSGLTSANDMADYYRQVIQYGLGSDYWNNRAAEVRALTAGQIDAAATKLIQPDQLNWIVVGDLSAIEADIRKLGIGTVSVIDTDLNVLR